MAYADATPAPAGDRGTQRYLDAIDRYDRGTDMWRQQCETINKIYLDQHRSNTSPRRFAMLWSNIETLKPAVYARTPTAVVSRRFKDADKIGRKAGEVLERCINTSFDLYNVDDVLQCVRDDRLLSARGQAWVRYEADVGEYEGDADSASGGAEPTAAQSGDGNVLQTTSQGTPEGTSAVQPGEKVSSATVEGLQGVPSVRNEKVCVEFVHYRDFGHDLRRTWPEVTRVWRCVYMTREAVEKRWGKEKAKRLNYVVRPEYAQSYGGRDLKDVTEGQSIIYEIWDKTRKKVIWIAKDEKTLLESGAPPLGFRDFFPCPCPAYGTHATGSLVPVPDYRYYQDQAEEINDLTEKISALQEWLVLKGFIPAGPSSEGSDAVMSMLQALSEKASSKAILVPVESMSGFLERGGAAGAIEWLPLDMVAGALKTCIEVRQALINDVYQITGISDILRGETDPNETLGAQELKAQTGSRRIQTCQRDLAGFARDIAELVGEVIAEHFQPETLAEMSGFDMTVEPPPELIAQAKMLMQQVQMLEQQPMPPQQPGQPPQPGPQPGQPPQGPPPNPALQKAQQQLQKMQQQLEQIEENKQVLQLLRNEKTRGYRIEIETDSTIEPDEQAEKQRRVEFLEVSSKFFQQAMPMLQVMPQAAPMLAQSYLFLVRGFRAGRELEDTVEQTMQAISQAANQPKSNPDEMKLQLEQKGMEAEQQFKTQEMKMRQFESWQKLKFEERKHDQEMQFEREKQQNELAMKGQEMQMREIEGQQAAQQKQAEMQQTDSHKQMEMEFNQRSKAEEMDFNRQSKSQDVDMKRQDMDLRKQEGEAGRTVEREKAGVPQANEALSAITEAIHTLAKTQKELAQAMNSPKRIIRGPDGRATGAETVRMN